MLDLDHGKDNLHLWTRDANFNVNQIWSRNGSLVVNVASQTCLAASKRDDDALLKADAKCDAADPLQQWAFDSATGLLALQPTVLSGQRHAQARGEFHFDTDASRGFNGAMCLLAGAPASPNGVAKFTAAADGVHHFYMDACPGGFGCGSGKTARLWIDGDDGGGSIFDWEQLTNMPNSITGRATLTKGKTYTLKYVAKGFKSATPPVLVQPPTYGKTTLRSNLGDLVDYYFTYGGAAGAAGAMDGAIAGYRAVTGAAPKYPLWAYGFWQCREHYATQSELLAAAHGFRNRSIPVDNIVQDWHYWGNLGWGPQWDPAFYPDPAAMVKELDGLHMKLMVSVWSKYDQKTSFFKDMTAKGQMLNGTVYYDAWNAEAREQFYQYSKKAHFDIGVACLWLDATEPEGFPNVDHNTALGSGNALMNSYSLETTRAISDGLTRDFTAAQGARPFALTRSAFAGQQGSGAALWSGDISGKWDSLRRQVAASLNYALSGMPYWSEDIGGFFRPSDQYTSADYHGLLCRWFQFGAFTPLYRVHGGGSHTEMWNYGDEVMGILNNTNNLRYRFLPYTYSGFHRVEAEGYTMQRHLVLDFGTEHANAADAFMWGDAVLVAPIVTQADNLAGSRDVALPLLGSSGGAARWYDFWSGETTAGTVRAAAPIEQSPLFVRPGSVLPLGPLRQWSGDSPGGPLEVRVYAGADGDFTLYEDDGASRDYQSGGSSTIAFAWDNAARTLTIGARQGTFAGMVASRTFTVVAVAEGRGTGLATEAEPDATITYTGAATTVKL